MPLSRCVIMVKTCFMIGVEMKTKCLTRYLTEWRCRTTAWQFCTWAHLFTAAEIIYTLSFFSKMSLASHGTWLPTALSYCGLGPPITISGMPSNSPSSGVVPSSSVRIDIFVTFPARWKTEADKFSPLLGRQISKLLSEPNFEKILRCSSDFHHLHCFMYELKSRELASTINVVTISTVIQCGAQR